MNVFIVFPGSVTKKQRSTPFYSDFSVHLLHYSFWTSISTWAVTISPMY